MPRDRYYPVRVAEGGFVAAERTPLPYLDVQYVAITASEVHRLTGVWPTNPKEFKELAHDEAVRAEILAKHWEATDHAF